MENKWWENYAVRYFVGTAVGALLVATINAEPGSPFEGRMAVIGDSKEVTFLGIGLVAALGFAFCYIASAPVLTLHATRAHLRISAIKPAKSAFLFALLVPSIVTIMVFWQILPPIAAAGSGLVVGIQLGLVLLATLKRFSVIEEFYRNLATVRADAAPAKDMPPTAGIEYVTSYRHLREHGNAFLIVFLEGLLAYTLIHSPSRNCAAVVLAIWLLPGASAWLFGTVLESRLVSKPLTQQANSSSRPVAP